MIIRMVVSTLLALFALIIWAVLFPGTATVWGALSWGQRMSVALLFASIDGCFWLGRRLVKK